MPPKNHYADITPAKGVVTVEVRGDDIRAPQIAESRNARKLIEHYKGKTLPPVYYIPKEDIEMGRLAPRNGHHTRCPIKGEASYFTFVGNGGRIENIAWAYESTLPESEAIRGLLAFDARRTRIRHRPEE